MFYRFISAFSSKMKIKAISAAIVIGSIYFILLDELIIGSAQRRIGPFNVGWYGIPSSIINGCNLIITQLIIPKVHFYFGFESFPICFFLLSIITYIIIYPFYLINSILSLVLIIIISGLSILFTILSAFSGNSKYSMLGCIRIISQLVSLELIWTTILSFFITSVNETSLAGSFLCNISTIIIFMQYWLYFYLFYLYLHVFLSLIILVLISSILSIN